MHKLICVAVLLAFGLVNLQAQDAEIPMLSYGDEIMTTMRKDLAESEFRFVGEAGDVIVIEATVDIDDILSGLFPEVSLLNARGTTIATTAGNYSLEDSDLFRATLSTELLGAGEYTIIINSSEVATLQQNAPFLLRLLNPQFLEVESTVEGFVESKLPSFYIVESNKAFAIEYGLINGTFYPMISVSRIVDGNLVTMASLYGQSLVGGSLIVEPNRNTLHVISASRSPFDLNSVYGDYRSEISITLSN